MMNVENAVKLIEKHLDLLGVEYSIDCSNVSKSTYFNVADTFVIRVSDHDLPISYKNHERKIYIGGENGHQNWEAAIEATCSILGIAPTKQFSAHQKRVATKLANSRKAMVSREQQMKLDAIALMQSAPESAWTIRTTKRSVWFSIQNITIVCDKGTTLEQAITIEIARLTA